MIDPDFDWAIAIRGARRRMYDLLQAAEDRDAALARVKELEAELVCEEEVSRQNIIESVQKERWKNEGRIAELEAKLAAAEAGIAERDANENAHVHGPLGRKGCQRCIELDAALAKLAAAEAALLVITERPQKLHSVLLDTIEDLRAKLAHTDKDYEALKGDLDAALARVKELEEARLDSAIGTEGVMAEECRQREGKEKAEARIAELEGALRELEGWRDRAVAAEHDTSYTIGLKARVDELEGALRFALSEGAGFACPESTEKLLLEALNGSARRVLGNE